MSYPTIFDGLKIVLLAFLTSAVSDAILWKTTYWFGILFRELFLILQFVQIIWTLKEHFFSEIN